MSPIDDELRRTLAGRATSVLPMLDPLPAIETRARAIHRRRQAVAGGCAVVIVAAGAALVPLLSKNTSPPPNPALTATPEPTVSASAGPESTPSAAPPSPGKAVGVYYLGDTGTRVVLYREFRRTTAPDLVRAAVEMMLEPPLDPDYLTLWPVGTKVRSVRIDGDLATVDLSAAARQGGTAGSAASCQSLQQLVWTVTAANTSIHRVTVSVEGVAQGVVSQWWGVGCGRDAPMVRNSPSYDIVAPVQISTPNEGDAVRSRFSFSGEATVFEATLSWSVVDASGQKLASGTSQATKGAPERGQWQADVVLKGVKPGDVVQLRAWEASAKDGSVTNLDTKRVTISN